MTKKPTQNFTYWFSVIVIGVVLGLGLQFVRAWTEPTTAPPGGNVGAPINTGVQRQDKDGSLAVWGKSGSGFGVLGYNSNGGAYGYLGYGGWGGLFGGPTYSTSYSYSTAMYDSNDSNYYVDPNGNSNLNKLNLSRTGAGECCSGGDATLSLAESTSSTGKKAGVQFHNSGVSEGQLRLDNGTNGRELKAYSYQTDMDLHATGVVQGDQGLCIGSDCRSSWPSTSSTDTLQTVTDRGWGTSQPLYSSNYMQAPVFYDANDSGYYVDPNGTSRLNYGVFNNAYAYGWMQAAIFYDANDNNYYVDPNGTSRMNNVVTNNINNIGVVGTAGFKMPTGAGAGKVLTSDASGFGSWQAQAAGGGGGCYVSYSGGCLAGFTNKGSTGKWGFCFNCGDIGCPSAFLPAGGSCAFGNTIEKGDAYVCCQN